MGDEDPGLSRCDGALEVFGQSAASAQPSKCPLDDPSTRQNLEAFCLVSALDDFHCELADLLQSAP